jgi:hypothetical protein
MLGEHAATEHAATERALREQASRKLRLAGSGLIENLSNRTLI